MSTATISLGGAIRTHRATDTMAGEVIRVATATHTYEVTVQAVMPTPRPLGEDDLADRRHVRLIGHVATYAGGSADNYAPVFLDRDGSIVLRDHTTVFVFAEAAR